MKGDLHMHSYFSDGYLSPEELALEAKRVGAEIVALTDHDTVNGVHRMNEACAKLGIKNIGGVELSAYKGCEIHLLGYCADFDSDLFKDFLLHMKTQREERMKKTVLKLNERGFVLSYEDVLKRALDSVSRAHIAKTMVDLKYEPDFSTCFSKWLKPESPCYVENTPVDPFEVVKLIKRLGGFAVLAHPTRIRMGKSDLADLVESLCAAGLDGIEASYKRLTDKQQAPYLRLAKKYKLLITNGGDFHSSTRNEIIPRELEKGTLSALFKK